MAIQQPESTYLLKWKEFNMKKSEDTLAEKINSLTKSIEWFDINSDLLSEALISALCKSPHVQGLQFTKGLREYHFDKLIDLLRDNPIIKKVKILDKQFPSNHPKNNTEKTLSELLTENINLRKILAEDHANANELIITCGKLLLFKIIRERVKQAQQPCWTIEKNLTNAQVTKLETLLVCNAHVQTIKIQGTAVNKHNKALFPHLAFNINIKAISEGQTKTLTIAKKLSPYQKSAAIKLISENRVTELLMQEHDWSLINDLPKQSELAKLIFIGRPNLDQQLERLMRENHSISTLAYCYNESDNHPTDLCGYSYSENKCSAYFYTNKFIASCSNMNPIELKLENAQLTAEKISIICDKISHFNSLLSLEITSVECDEGDAMLILLRALLNNHRIQLRQLKLNKVNLSDEAFNALILLLEAKPDLTRLNLRNIKMDKNKITKLNTLLVRNIPLSHLELAQTELNNDLVHDLCVALESNSKLASLNLSQNTFDMTGIASLKRLLSQNRIIHSVSLELSCLKGDDAKQFAIDLKKSNCSITDLSLSHVTDKVNVPTTDERGIRSVKPAAYFKKFQESIDTFINNNRQKRDQLFDFVRRGETANAEKALAQRISPNCCDSEGNTPLHIMVQLPRINQDMIRLFVSQGANTKTTNNAGKMAFDFLDPATQTDILALLTGNPTPKKKQGNQANSIISYFKPNDGANRKRDRAPSAATAEPPDDTTVKQIKVEAAVESAQPFDLNEIIVALMNDAVQLIMQMINAHNCQLQFDDGNFLLHVATLYQAQHCVKYLLQVGSDPSHANAFGQLALHLACLNLSSDASLIILNTLITAQPQTVNRVDQLGLTPLYCLTGGFTEQIRVRDSDKLRALAAKTLLAHHADLQYFVYDYQEHEKLTVLHKAIARRCYRLTKVLLAHTTCNPTLPDSHGWSPLHHAVFQGDLLTIARLLMHPSILPDLPDQHGTTPRQLAKSEHFAAHVNITENLKEQIGRLFEQRARQRFPQLNSGIYWAKELTIRYGSRYNRNHDLVLQFEAEHSRLQNAAGASRSQNGNYLTASLSFIISKGKHKAEERLPRTHITINLIFTDKFHVTDGWESREQIERRNGLSLIKKVTRSPDALNRIITRLKSTPTDIFQSATHDITNAKTHLSEKGIYTLFYMPDFEVGDYDFEQRFHHSEQGLFDHLQDPELIDQLLAALQQHPDFQTGCKIYGVVLNAFSKHYMCPDCMASTLGFQNTEQGEFFKLLKGKLTQLQCALPKTGSLKSITLFSANSPTRHQHKASVEDHIPYDPIDLRTINNNIILTQDADVCKPKGTTYNSRK